MSLCPDVFAKNLVSDDFIKRTKSATKVTKLKNGIPVVIRREGSSPITVIGIHTKTGVKDFKTVKEKLTFLAMADAMTMASKNHSRSDIHAIMEKYSLSISCDAGLEQTNCFLVANNRYWQEGFALFKDIRMQPVFNEENLNLVRDRTIAGYNSTISNPERYANEVVNRVFYPEGHPFKMTVEESQEAIKLVSSKDLSAMFQASMLSPSNHFISVVSSLEESLVLKELEAAFGKMKGAVVKSVPVGPPAYNPKKAYAFEERPTDTAYILLKFNLPGASPDNIMSTSLFAEMLRERLWDEIRTKQSLSYSIGAYVIQHSTGIGVIHASTSQPEKTLQAIDKVLTAFSKSAIPKKDFEPYKNVFSTSYFLSQESNQSIAGTMASFYGKFSDTDVAAELPLLLGKATNKDVLEMAQSYLKNFRMGIVFQKKRFDEKIAADFLKKWEKK